MSPVTTARTAREEINWAREPLSLERLSSTAQSQPALGSGQLSSPATSGHLISRRPALSWPPLAQSNHSRPYGPGTTAAAWRFTSWDPRCAGLEPPTNPLGPAAQQPSAAGFSPAVTDHGPTPVLTGPARAREPLSRQRLSSTAHSTSGNPLGPAIYHLPAASGPASSGSLNSRRPGRSPLYTAAGVISSCRVTPTMVRSPPSHPA